MSRHVSRFVAALWAGAIVAYATPAAAQVTCATLTSGSSVPVSGTKGTQACFQITVPEEQTSLSVTLTPGSGNADLYVRFGTVPTTRSYDCRSTSKTSRERCEITTPAAGVWYVLVQAYTSFSDFTLGATYDGPSSVTTLTNGVPAPDLGASPGSPLYFKIQVPATRSTLRFALAGGTGNADLYVRAGALPSLRSYGCKSAIRGTSTETCTITAPANGTWYAMVYPATTFSGASLTATYSGAGGLILVSGGGQVGAVNTLLPKPVVARLEQGDGTPIQGVNVLFNVTSGGGIVTASSVPSGADGTASVGWTLGLTRAPQQLTVSARDLDGNPLTLTVTASANGPLVVNSLADSVTPPAGQITLRLAWGVATSGETISFATALDGQTILLDVVGDAQSVLKGELYDASSNFLGYAERNYGKSALYARKNVVLDASALTNGITLRWNGGDASHARVLAVYGDLTMTNVNVSSGYSFSEAITPNTPQPFTLARGGGIAVWGTAKLTRCRVVGNTIASPPEVSGRDLAAYGGGIYANGLNLVDCVVSGNRAMAGGAAGGGIYSVGGADKTTGTGNETYLDRCAVTGNYVQGVNAYGGGIFTLSGGPNNLATMHISNSTIAQNFVAQPPGAPTMYYRGGGIYMGGGSLELVASTVAENDVQAKQKLNASGQPQTSGGGIAATIGNAHTVEYVWVQNSIVVGNGVHEVQPDGTTLRKDEDWFVGSLIEFNSGGYNLIGQIEFRWILVPIPAWMDLSRKHWPKTGDNEEPVTLADALDVANVQLDDTVTSFGKAGGQAVLWYPPGPKAIDKVPLSAYSVQNVYGGYTGYGTSTDDFLNHVVAKVQSKYPTLILSSAFTSQDRTGITWYGPARTWPSEPANASWIAFWRALDEEIGTQLGMEYLADDFWGSFTTGPLDAYRTMTINRTSTSYVHEPWDQTYRARPQGALVDIGAIEK